MNNIDKTIEQAIEQIAKEDGHAEITDMLLSLIKNISSDSIDQESVDLIIQNLIEQLG